MIDGKNNCRERMPFLIDFSAASFAFLPLTTGVGNEFSHLLTTMGMGRVRMKMPQRAQRPPISLPGKVDGESSP